MKAFHTARVLALPCLTYTLAAMFITWPLVTQLSTHAIGAGYGDQFENVRLIWWQQYALQHGLNPFYQSMLGYPQGFFSATQIAEPLTYWLATPIAFITGAVTAFNLIVFFCLILNGLSVYILCSALIESDVLTPPPRLRGRGLGGGVNLPALLGGLVFMAFPTLQGHLSAGHINVLALYGLPIYALCLYHILNAQSTRRTVIIGAVAFAVTALGSVGQIVYTLFPLTFFFLLYYLLFDRPTLFRRPIIRNLALLFVMSALLLLPFYFPLFAQLSGSERSADLQETGWVAYSTDPLGFVSLSPFTPWGTHLAPAYTRTTLGTNSAEGSAYLGIIALFLALVALIRLALKHQAQPTKSTKLDSSRSQSTSVDFVRSDRDLSPGLWILIALGSMLFSLGPLLKWLDAPAVYTLGDFKSYIVLPWAFFQSLPFFNATRTPGRFNIVTGLALAVLAAFGLRYLLSRLTRPRLRFGLTGLLMLAILGEYQLFFPALTTPATIPPIFYELAKRTDIRAVFDIPWDNPLAAKEALYYQTAHQKPLIAGHVTRKTPIDPAKLILLEALVDPTNHQFVTDSQSNLLIEMGIDVVVVHLGYLQDVNKHLYKITGILGKPLYQDENIALFDVRPTSTTLSSRLPQVTNFLPGAISTTFLYVPKEEYIDLNVSEMTPDFQEFQTDLWLFEVDGQITGAGHWKPYTHLDRNIKLKQGFHTLRILTPNPSAKFYPDVFALPDTAQTEINMNVGGPLSLERYTSWQYQAVINITTLWHITQKLKGEYHIFFHFLDDSGNIVWQYDNQPGNGEYSSTKWSDNQYWSEQFSFSTYDVPPGTYQLYTGWYSYPDMQRLPVYADTPHAKDGLVYLGSVTIGKP